MWGSVLFAAAVYLARYLSLNSTYVVSNTHILFIFCISFFLPYSPSLCSTIFDFPEILLFCRPRCPALSCLPTSIHVVGGRLNSNTRIPFISYQWHWQNIENNSMGQQFPMRGLSLCQGICCCCFWLLNGRTHRRRPMKRWG